MLTQSPLSLDAQF